MQLQVSRNRAVDLAPMKDESVLFHPDINKFCLLNTTAAFLWNQLEKPHTIPELGQLLTDHFDSVSITEATRNVEGVVNELLALKCLESSQTGTSDVLNEERGPQAYKLASVREEQGKARYMTPQVKVLTEQEVLSAFQVTAAGTSMWWT
jgi:hypothetical protein